FFFHATAPPALYTLSLHDALPIYPASRRRQLRYPRRRGKMLRRFRPPPGQRVLVQDAGGRKYRNHEGLRCEEDHHPVPALLPDLDRKSTRLNSSHVKISYAVFCLK